MKIICVNNFAREDISDELICENVNKYYAEDIVNFLNKKFSGESAPDFFKAVDDNYKLYVYEI